MDGLGVEFTTLGEEDWLCVIVGEVCLDSLHGPLMLSVVITWRGTRIPDSRKRLCFAAKAFPEWIEKSQL